MVVLDGRCGRGWRRRRRPSAGVAAWAAARPGSAAQGAPVAIDRQRGVVDEQARPAGGPARQHHSVAVEVELSRVIPDQSRTLRRDVGEGHRRAHRRRHEERFSSTGRRVRWTGALSRSACLGEVSTIERRVGAAWRTTTSDVLMVAGEFRPRPLLAARPGAR